MANRLSRIIKDFLPMISSSIIRDFAAEIDDPDVIVATESIVIHHHDLQHQVLQVESWHQKLERLVENRDECVFLDLGLPLPESLSLVDEVDLHIGICEREGKRERHLSKNDGRNEDIFQAPPLAHAVSATTG